MKRTKHSPTSPGFSAVTLILALVIILGIGGVGWYVWHSRQTKPTTNTPSSNNTPNEETPVADPTEGGKYLVIKEWGVRFPLPETLKNDLLYAASDGIDGESSVIFASKKLNNLTGDTSCTLNMQPNGKYGGGIQATLLRINPKTYTAATREYYQSLRDFVKTIGEYEYYSLKPIKNPPVTCLTGQHEEFNSVERSITDELKAAFKQAEVY